MKKKPIKLMPIYYILPLLLIAAVVPLIVHLKVIPIDDISFKFWIGDKENADFFSYYKAILTIALAAASLFMFILARYKKIVETKRLIIYYIPIIVYAVMIVLSTLLSKYPNTARMGFVDRYEGVFVLLAYLAILFTTINLVNSEKLIKTILSGLFFAAFGVCIIGVLQFFGMDLFKSEFGKLLILPTKYRNLNMSFTFGPHTIYSTLYNTNFVGSFMALFLPLSFAAFLYSKDLKFKIISGAFTCLMFANWLGCRSRAGYIGGSIAVLILIIAMRKLIIKNIKSVIPLSISIVLVFIGMNYAANGELGGRIITSISNIGNYSANNNDENEQSAKKTQLNDIVFGDKKVSIVYGKNILNMSLAGTQLEFSDTEGKVLAVKNYEEGNISFSDTRYMSYHIALDRNSNTFDVKLNDMNFLLYVDQNGFKIVGERNLLLDKIDHPESIGFKDNEKFASMRGYIWSRSIPLLKNNIIIGGGPDTFVMQFPQHDYVGKLRAFGMVNEIVDKPHNMFLQIGINTGVLSLLAVIFLFAVYLLSSAMLYFKKGDMGDKGLIGTALFVAVLGYSIAALVNDSLVSVAPVFWIILGLGISCNFICKNANNKEMDLAIKQAPGLSPKQALKHVPKRS